jgi:hypothetical protein
MNCCAEPGGIGHLILTGRSGIFSHADAKKRIHRFAAEVPPRLHESPPVVAA